MAHIPGSSMQTLPPGQKRNGEAMKRSPRAGNICIWLEEMVSGMAAPATSAPLRATAERSVFPPVHDGHVHRRGQRTRPVQGFLTGARQAWTRPPLAAFLVEAPDRKLHRGLKATIRSHGGHPATALCASHWSPSHHL